MLFPPVLLKRLHKVMFITGLRLLNAAYTAEPSVPSLPYFCVNVVLYILIFILWLANQ